MADADYRARLEDCREALADAGADAAVLFPGSNLRYLTGFDESPSERHLLLFVGRGGAAFVAPKLYVGQLRAETPVEAIHGWSDCDDPLSAVEAVAEQLNLGAGRVLVDDTLWARFTLDLREALPNASLGLASEVMEGLRVRKDAAELDALREAARRSDRVSEAIRGLGDEVIGWTEAELATEIRSRLYEASPEGPSFEPVAASGPNGARPHHRHGDRVIEAGDPVVLDFGAWVDGYAGDQTRTVAFAGEPPEEFLEAHAVVREALEAGVAAVEPGVEAQAVDRAARDVIEDAGYGDAFIHRTGHGVGLEVHEAPYIVEGNTSELEPGMVFSVEPGIYVEGEWGVRVEDLVAVTADGYERLNDSPRTWQPL